MKKTVFITMIMVLAAIAANAQQVKPEWVTIKSPNLRCWQCKDQLDKYLLIEKGITESGIVQWKINLLQGEIRIQYLPNYITPEALRVTLNNAGYDTDSSKAEPEAYKKIPPPCKRTEDGGGPQKGKPCHIGPLN